MKKQRRIFTAEFKQEAASMVLDPKPVSTMPTYTWPLLRCRTMYAP